NQEEWGKGFDETMADDEIVSLIAQAEGVDGPFSSQALMACDEIPLGVSTNLGNVIQAFTVRAAPGKMVEAIDSGKRLAAVLLRLGAQGARAFQLGATGTQAGLLVAAIEYSDMRSLGKAMDQLQADAEGQALVDEAQGASSPTLLVSYEIFTQIPL